MRNTQEKRSSMSMKKVLLAFCILAFILVIGRIYYVNVTAAKAPISVLYNEQEWVSLRGNYFNDAYDEMTDGYSVRVDRSELMSVDEYYNKYSISELNEELNGKYVVNITVTIKNEQNTEGKLLVSQWCLVGKYHDYYTVMSPSLLMLSDDRIKELVSSLSVEQNTEKSITLPFLITDMKSVKEIMDNSPFELTITKYPEMNTIRLNLVT